ncbi:unnamed protein product [Ambrosiozyma monospora]|uniref:Unnamed protein product n=1 Tax=Ambrosiozyma monospora TaxID=43982 RepID=A0ACB5U958_AMBMO|nr:unnamed protein product [Ambrosiozyma monospora]
MSTLLKPPLLIDPEFLLDLVLPLLMISVVSVLIELSVVAGAGLATDVVSERLDPFGEVERELFFDLSGD